MPQGNTEPALSPLPREAFRVQGVPRSQALPQYQWPRGSVFRHGEFSQVLLAGSIQNVVIPLTPADTIDTH